MCAFSILSAYFSPMTLEGGGIYGGHNPPHKASCCAICLHLALSLFQGQSAYSYGLHTQDHTCLLLKGRPAAVNPHREAKASRELTKHGGRGHGRRPHGGGTMKMVRWEDSPSSLRVWPGGGLKHCAFSPACVRVLSNTSSRLCCVGFVLSLGGIAPFSSDGVPALLDSCE